MTFALGAMFIANVCLAGDDALQSFQHCSQMLKDFSGIVLRHSMAWDRGYSDKKTVVDGAHRGISHTGPIKKSRSPFTDDPRQRDKIYVNPEGDSALSAIAH